MPPLPAAIPIPPISVIPNSNMYPIPPIPPPIAHMSLMSNLFGPNTIGPNTPITKPLKLIPWHPKVSNNGRGARPAKELQPLRKVKIHKSLRSKKKPKDEFDYGVEYKKPKKISRPMSPKKHQIVQGYNPDASLHFAPTFMPDDPQVLLKLSKNNDFLSNNPSFEGHDHEFTLFDKLPVEIRRRIWRHAVPSDRLVKIDRIDRMAEEYVPSFYTNGAPRSAYRVHTSYPGLLGACKESRTIGFEFYKLSFGHRLEHRPIYFDFSRDILYFEETQALNQFSGTSHFEQDVDTGFEMKLTGDLLKIQRVIVGGRLKRDTIHILGLYENLKSITFEEQFFLASYGKARAPNREAMALSDLWAKKSDGGSGLPNVKVTFQSEQMMMAIGSSVVWRKGMLDM